MTDDFEIPLHWGIVLQYRQSIAFRNSLLEAKRCKMGDRRIIADSEDFIRGGRG